MNGEEAEKDIRDLKSQLSGLRGFNLTIRECPKCKHLTPNVDSAYRDCWLCLVCGTEWGNETP